MENVHGILLHVRRSHRWMIEMEAPGAPTPAPSIGFIPEEEEEASTSASNSGDDTDPTKSVLEFLLLLILSFVTLCVLMGAGQLILRCAQRVFCPQQYQQQQEAMQRQQRDRQYASSRQHTDLMYDQGTLAKAAGLSPGLLFSERQLILESIFKSRLLTYDDLEEALKHPKVLNQGEGELEEVVLVDSVAETLDTTETETTEEGPPAKEEAARPAQNSQNETMCSICLTEYHKLDTKLVKGTQCSHVFHYECCLEWLKKQDHCPYCRMEMVSCEQFRKAAQETLGSERIDLLPIVPLPESFLVSTFSPRGRHAILQLPNPSISPRPTSSVSPRGRDATLPTWSPV